MADPCRRALCGSLVCMIRLPPGSTRFPYTTLFRSITQAGVGEGGGGHAALHGGAPLGAAGGGPVDVVAGGARGGRPAQGQDRKSTRLNSSHRRSWYAVLFLKKNEI